MTPRGLWPGDQHVDHRWITCPPSNPNLWTNHSGVTTRCWGQPYVAPPYSASRHGPNRRFEGTTHRDVACRARPPTERGHTTARWTAHGRDMPGPGRRLTTGVAHLAAAQAAHLH